MGRLSKLHLTSTETTWIADFGVLQVASSFGFGQVGWSLGVRGPGFGAAVGEVMQAFGFDSNFFKLWAPGSSWDVLGGCCIV